MKEREQYIATIRRDQKQPRLFKNKIVERLTYTSPFAIILMYWVVTAIMIYFYATEVNPAATTGYIVRWFFIGFFSWTLGEYVLHRWLYHSIKDASYDKGHHFLLHGIHHEYPNDTSRIVLPPIPSLGLAAAIFGLVFLGFLLVTGSGDIVFVFGSGFLNGYLAYMSVHYIVHTVPSPKKYNFWWRHHNVHHFQQHDRAFGVSTPIWDIIFRTMPEKGRKTIVEKKLGEK